MSEPVLEPTEAQMPPAQLIQFRRADESLWLSVNPILKTGEPGIVTDKNQYVLGDGQSTFDALDRLELAGTNTDDVRELIHSEVSDPESDTSTILSDRVDAQIVESRNPRYVPNRFYTGPASTDSVTITTGVALDAAFNEQYAISGNTLPSVWPVDIYGNTSIVNNIITAKTSNPGTATVTTYRFWIDGPELLIFTYASGFWIDLFIDGRPYASNPVVPAATAGLNPFGMQKLVFSSAKPRLIELRMVGGLVGVYLKKPYRAWKPQPDLNPSICVVGDSYVAPTVMNDASSGSTTTGYFLQGIYQRMAAELGITRMTSDGVGGTGYINGGGSNTPYGNTTRLNWLQNLQPNVAIIHGGGANDLFQGNSVASIITAARSYFNELRTRLPNSKLVFVEGFTPPLFTPGTYNPNYIAIRQGVQSGLSADGVDVYFIDVATTRPPITGTGYVTAATGVGNSDIYVGSDATHLTIAGNRYVRSFLVPKVARILADEGALVGTLI